MKTIPLTQGKVALVDDKDWEWLSQWKWHVSMAGRNWYARANIGKRRIYMHQLILQTEDTVDHKDHDGLNNQRGNLRPANKRQQGMNAKLRIDNPSGFKGVCRNVGQGYKKPWRAVIVVEGRQVHLGSFFTAEEASSAYVAAAAQYFGEFAYIPTQGQVNDI